MKIIIRNEVTRVVSHLAPAQERLLRDQDEREAIVYRAFQLYKSGVSHPQTLDDVMHVFDITRRSKKEQGAYRQFITIALNNESLTRDRHRCELIR